MKNNIEYYGSQHGASFVDGKAQITFSILGAESTQSIEEDKQNYKRFAVIGDRLTIEGHTVATFGEDNSLPYQLKQAVKNNPFLPEILKKQVRIMYGRGAGLYSETEDSEGKPTRKWVTTTYKQVIKWLNSWEKDSELDSFQTYAKRAIHEYYYLEGFCSRYLLNKSRRVAGSLPVRGLKIMNGADCRLATKKVLDRRQKIKDSDLDLVLEGSWTNINQYNVDIWPRFKVSDPFRYPSAVNYVRDRGFDEDIYSLPTFFYGLLEWITGVNLNPKYINSYLKNSLSAKLHVIIPDSWIRQREDALKDTCRENEKRAAAGKKIIEVFEGIKIGTEYNNDLLVQLVNNKITELTNVLSGSGENQGKALWTRSFMNEKGIEKWIIEEIPTKYKEFIESILSFNKEGLKMILAGKGLDPAISSISNEGIFNSGAQVYYAYLVYLDTLHYAEEFILEDVNRAARLNFPELETNNIRIGFMRFAPERQQEVSPENRMDNNLKQ